MSFWAIVRESAIAVLRRAWGGSPRTLRNLLTYPQVAAAGGAMQLTTYPRFLSPQWHTSNIGVLALLAYCGLQMADP